MLKYFDKLTIQDGQKSNNLIIGQKAISGHYFFTIFGGNIQTIYNAFLGKINPQKKIDYTF